MTPTFEQVKGDLAFTQFVKKLPLNFLVRAQLFLVDAKNDNTGELRSTESNSRP